MLFTDCVEDMGACQVLGVSLRPKERLGSYIILSLVNIIINKRVVQKNTSDQKRTHAFFAVCFEDLISEETTNGKRHHVLGLGIV